MSGGWIMDKKILEVIIHHYKGGPCALVPLLWLSAKNPKRIEEVYEPYLIMQGFF